MSLLNISDSGLLLLSHGAPWISICDMTGLMLQHIPVCGDWIISVLHAVRLSTPFLVRYHVSYHPIVSFMGSYSPRGPIKEPMMLHHFFFLTWSGLCICCFPVALCSVPDLSFVVSANRHWIRYLCMFRMFLRGSWLRWETVLLTGSYHTVAKCWQIVFSFRVNSCLLIISDPWCAFSSALKRWWWWCCCHFGGLLRGLSPRMGSRISAVNSSWRPVTAGLGVVILMWVYLEQCAVQLLKLHLWQANLSGSVSCNMILITWEKILKKMEDKEEIVTLHGCYSSKE